MLKTSLMINYRPISIFPSYPKYLKGLCIDYINISQNTTYYTVSSLETMRKPNEKQSFEVKDEKSIQFINVILMFIQH